MGKGVQCNKLNRISGHVVLDVLNKSNNLISRLLQHVSERSPASFSLFLFCSGVHVDVIYLVGSMCRNALKQLQTRLHPHTGKGGLWHNHMC